MTLMFPPRAASRCRTAPRSGVTAEQFGCQGPGDGPAEPQGLGIQELDRLPRGGIGTLETGGEIADNGLVDGELPIGAEFDDQGAKQLVVWRLQLDGRHRTQP